MSDKKPDTALGMLAICLTLAYLLPYQMYPYLTFYHEWLALFGVALAVAFISQENLISLRIPWIVLAPVGLMILIGLHWAMGRLTYHWDAVLPLAYLTGSFFALMIGATLSAQGDGLTRLCSTLAWVHLTAGLVSGLIATLQITATEGQIYPFAMPMQDEGVIRPYANLGQPNQLALLFCLAIASAWFLYQRGKLNSTICLAAILILLWGLALTQSRIGWIIIPLFVLFSAASRNYKTLKPVPVWLPAILFSGYVGLIAALPEIDFGVDSEDRAGSPDDREGSIRERWVLIQQAWRMSLNHPWLGSGWFEFGPEQLRISADFEPTLYSHHAHNIVLNCAAELGWPATIVLFSALAYWFFQVCLRPMLDRSMTPECGFSALFLSAVLVHSLVEYPLWYAYILIPTSLIMGAVHQERLGSRVWTVPRAMPAAIFMVAALSLLMSATDYRRLVTGLRAHGWEKLGLPPEEGSSKKPEWTVFPHFYDFFQFERIKARENMPADEIAFMAHLAKRFGGSTALMKMSFVYAFNGREEEAVRTLKTMKSLFFNQYKRAYAIWEAMAESKPEKYAGIFAQLPNPVQLPR